ncbi:hypothetical protein GQ53DRAFT_756460 [Thozetella sp. PMI_491]|nr:hypothetical protein GQ53DRAFT_756460 [Thozetella sp. PMI_491]
MPVCRILAALARPCQGCGEGAGPEGAGGGSGRGTHNPPGVIHTLVCADCGNVPETCTCNKGSETGSVAAKSDHEDELVEVMARRRRG